jgi:hypothetical protein
MLQCLALLLCEIPTGVKGGFCGPPILGGKKKAPAGGGGLGVNKTPEGGAFRETRHLAEGRLRQTSFEGLQKGLQKAGPVAEGDG